MFLKDSIAGAEQVSHPKKEHLAASVETQAKSPVEPAVNESDEAAIRSRKKKMEEAVSPVPSPKREGPSEGRKGYDLVQPALSALASLGLCFLGALIMHEFPEFLFDYISRQQSDPESVWPLSEYYCWIAFAAIFALLVVALPLLAVVSKSRWLGYGQDRRLTKCICLLLWCVFFGCLAPLNISTSFLLLLATQPVLMIVYLCASRFVDIGLICVFSYFCGSTALVLTISTHILVCVCVCAQF
ncbi:unnamed protein product [Dibothriocephalus latus]|uniref:Uncharacterized protein n=1 Tax=Dibothriocephalus latus TaxID=60516 RepID=A0A3P7PCP9_DIBLA|nr:unnamed protein product [Dibothriocephalus latus]